jgi:hypothetical protein
MKKIITSCIFAAALGILLATIGFSVLTWQFWVISGLYHGSHFVMGLLANAEIYEAKQISGRETRFIEETPNFENYSKVHDWKQD